MTAASHPSAYTLTCTPLTSGLTEQYIILPVHTQRRLHPTDETCLLACARHPLVEDFVPPHSAPLILHVVVVKQLCNVFCGSGGNFFKVCVNEVGFQRGLRG